jgi:glycosyltransferase involved in cell wall biosynthesis
VKKLYFTVTNDLTYDQRMHRICHSLATNGYAVTLVGRDLPMSKPLEQKTFQQVRLPCWFNKGFLFYAEYNLRLFFYLFAKPVDAICAIDLDTILPCLLLSKYKSIPRIYDAHEYFTELKEVRTRPHIKAFWAAVEQATVPRYHLGYTVSGGLAEVFKQRYNRDYALVRNMPVKASYVAKQKGGEYLFYGGAVNEGRGFEVLIPAMQKIPYRLIVAGDGNFMPQLKALIMEHDVEEKVIIKGMLLPTDIKELATRATLGIALAEKEGINQYLALPNKFFDYMHAGLPQIAMNYPEYTKINDVFNVAVLLDDLSVDAVTNAINSTMMNKKLLQQMARACLEAKEVFNWDSEEKSLLLFYKNVFKD